MSTQPYCFCELAPLYALGSLGAEEKQWVEQQIQDNPELAEELAEYQGASATLPYATDPDATGLDVTDLDAADAIAPLSTQAFTSLKRRLFAQLNLAAPPMADAVEAVAVCPPAADELQRDQAGWVGMISRSQDHPWQPHPEVPGVEIAIFHEDPTTREVSGLLRAEPGVQYPAHRHASTEEIYMLSGELYDGETVYCAGDYIRSLPGSIHSPWTDSGCSFFFRTSLDDKFEHEAEAAARG